jgi:ceramide glucosyltransferase
MVLAIIAALFAAVGMLQSWLGLWAVKRFAASAPARCAALPRPLPAVTVLKPLCGDEPLLEAALESCFTQDYPDFQIVFGVQSAADPALAVVEALRQRYPERDVAVVINSKIYGLNRKVSNLINMLPSARHDLLVISDSDLHLSADYLDSLVAQMAKPGTGLVTALYVGIPPEPAGLPAQLGVTQINHHFLPGVLLSRLMGRQDCLGSTAMFSRDTLERIGGFAPLAEVLAEDNLLGQRVKYLGLSVALTDLVPSAMVPEPCLVSLWLHEVRWTRTIRELAPCSLVASLLQYSLFWSLLAVVTAPLAAGTWLLFLSAWATRALCARSVDHALRHHVGRATPPVNFWLLPLRDLLSVAEIAASFVVNHVTWRGHRMAADGVVSAPVDAVSRTPVGVAATTVPLSDVQHLGRVDSPRS